MSLVDDYWIEIIITTNYILYFILSPSHKHTNTNTPKLNKDLHSFSSIKSSFLFVSVCLFIPFCFLSSFSLVVLFVPTFLLLIFFFPFFFFFFQLFFCHSFFANESLSCCSLNALGKWAYGKRDWISNYQYTPECNMWHSLMR